jgi:hypothetical protein
MTELVYRDVDWAHGLQCPECGHAFREGERFSTLLDSFSEDGDPMCRVVCVACALSSAAHPVRPA